MRARDSGARRGHERHRNHREHVGAIAIVAAVQEDISRKVWGVNMSRCDLTSEQMRTSHVPPQFTLSWNRETQKFDCVMTFSTS